MTLKWIKKERNELDIKKGYNLCPICKKDTLEDCINEDDVDEWGADIIAERCSNGCYNHKF